MGEHLICVPVCEQYAKDVAPAIARAAEAGDIIELRLDCLNDAELKAAEPEISAALLKGDGSFILTFRPAEQGGARPLTLVERFSYISGKCHDGWQRRSTLLDVELDLALLIKKSEEYLGSLCDWERTICSHHDFAKTPEDIERIYKSMVGTPARILKIALHANDITDCIAVFNLLDLAKRDGREMIAIAMGAAGTLTRILGPSRGAFLTYGAADSGHATAAGQITSDELRGLYRIEKLSRSSEITGLMGSPVSHSVSPHMHNAAFAAQNLNAVYIPFEVRDAGQFITRMVDPKTREIEWNLRGLSVTSPHKGNVVPYLDWIEPSAREAGAVNTIVVREERLYGYNSDVAAFLSPLRKKLGTLAGLNCAIIGAGGAARGVLCGLKREGAAATIFVRRPDAARVLAAEFGVESRELASARFKPFDIVVNATPVGSFGRDDPGPIVTAEQLSGARLAYDLVYNPVETLFLKEAAKARCERIGGLEMLVAQAAAQFELWTGQEAPSELMFEAASRALAASFGCTRVKSYD